VVRQAATLRHTCVVSRDAIFCDSSLSSPLTGSLDFLPSSPHSVFEGHRDIIVLWIIWEGSLFCYHSGCHVLLRLFYLYSLCCAYCKL